MEAKELVEKARDQRKRGRFDEAVISAKAATLHDPENADAWWQLALNSYSVGNKEAAWDAIIQTNDLAPHFAQGWSKRGQWELEDGDAEEAESSFYIALDCEEDNLDALLGLAGIYAKLDADKSEKRVEEIRILTKLDQMTALEPWSVNRLGILHFLNKHGFDAIKYWSRNARGNDDTASMFNLGLAYNMDDVSQDVDAIDCWRMVLRLNASHKAAPIRIEALKPRLLELARTVRSLCNSICLPEDQWYSVYLNPFQLLNCPSDFDFEDIEPKIVQAWKKTLLQEIELEEGKLDWMPGLIIDRSKAIEITNSLSNIDIAHFHWYVYRCKPLLEFLSKGDINHFLLDEDWSPLELLEFVGESDEFREWLSDPFSIQYDRVFTKAVTMRDVPTIEAMLDGRRWVLPSYADRCFENALRQAEKILTPLSELKKRAESIKVSANEIESVLNQNKIIAILNFLPPYFREIQNEAVRLVRSMAIDAHNIHDDTDLSLGILEISKRFSFKSVELVAQLKEDYDTASEMIRSQREHESHLTFGNKRAWKVTKEGILDNGELCPVDEIRALRWGILIKENRAQNYFFAAKRSTGKEYVVTWTSSNQSQRELFDGLLKAAFHYLIPSLIEYLHSQLKRNGTLIIGSIQVTQFGVSFETKGLFLTKQVQIPWSRADITTTNGSVIVADKSTGKKSLPISLRDVANAPMLPLLQMSINHS